MNHDLDHRFVYLLSMPRSGSTLFSMMLGSHADVCCPPEPWIVLLLAEYLKLGDVSETPYGRQWAEMASIEFLLNADRKSRGALRDAFGKINEVIGLGKTEAAKRLLQMAYRMYLELYGKRMFVDKTPRYYAVLGLIDEIFPRSKKIVLLRNPLDIYASYKSTWNNAKNIFDPDGVTVGTRDYCEGLFALADLATSTRTDVLVVRYEELVNKAEETLEAVCKYLDLKDSSSMLAYHENKSLAEEYGRSPVGDQIVFRQKTISKQSANSWAARLDLAEIQALVDVLGKDLFERLGYQDTVIKLRQMQVTIPTEEYARERRSILMHALRDRVHERPFSIWENFALPLKQRRDELDRMRTVRGSLRYWCGSLRSKIVGGLFGHQ